ncbi:MAG TPA: molybdopterin cofactor-binding domain-containing protein, partial [Thermomicrobiales bacterium]|nr:molybdopterin cofactor-binding domain-containing protein [Thermomicrobiales bacterium]
PTLDWQGFNALVLGDVTSVFFAGRSTVANRRNAFFQAGASARERLKSAAAARWGVTAADVTVASSVLTNTKTGKTLRYGDVAKDAAAVTLAKEPAIKDPSEWTLLGKEDFGKLNNELIVTGKATYGIDVQVDGMKYAAVAQSPVQGGVLKSYDFNTIKDMPGVIKVVEVKATTRHIDKPPILAMNGDMQFINSAVAVVADHYWQAHQALAALKIEWDSGDGAKWATIDQVKKSAFDRIDAGEVKPYQTIGDPAKALAAGKVVSGDYWTPYSEHSMMEPLNGTALVKDDTLEIWMPTSESLQAYSAVQQETGFDPAKITFHPTYVGGSFGRRTNGDDARMVAAVAKGIPGVPVHVIWTREQTFIGGRYRAAVATRAKAVLGEDGIPTVLLLESVAGNQAGWFASPLLQGNPIPNVAVGTAPINTHLLAGPYRGPGYNAAGFILDSFVDELAHAAGIDPLEYRIKLFEPYLDPGYVRALNVAAEKIGWGTTLPKGEGLGIAIANWSQDLQQKPPFLGSTTATAAHVKVDKDGTLHVLRLEVVPELGTVINHDAVDQQIHGGTIFGLNTAMNEELTLNNGALVETNFDKYPMLRMADMPEINVHFDALTGDPRYSEAGEVPVGPVGPAIANAIFAAIGKRVREMPFRKADLTWL